MWEDAANIRGGRWLINLEKKQRNDDLDRFWLDVVSVSFLILSLDILDLNINSVDFVLDWRSI